MIETERLILRKWTKKDYDPFVLINQDPAVMKYFPSVLSRKEVLELIGRIEKHFDEWGFGFYACELKEDNSFIGFIGLGHPRFESDFTPCVEIGWRLAQKVWGRGLATEGAKAIVNYAFEILELKELYSFTSLDNRPSFNVMKKIGMKKVGKFFHPNLPKDSPLSEHWIYHLSAKSIP